MNSVVSNLTQSFNTTTAQMKQIQISLSELCLAKQQIKAVPLHVVVLSHMIYAALSQGQIHVMLA